MSSLTINLKNKVVLITGALGIQGPEHTKAFKRTGAKVISTDIIGGDYQLDVTSKKSIDLTVKKIIKKYKRIDVLVNNAGTIGKQMKKASAPVEKQKLSDWEAIIKVNLTGVWLCCQVVGKQMAKQKSGSIINISSIYGLIAPDFMIYSDSKYNNNKSMGTPAAYSASKGGVISLTKYLASYWAKDGIRVNCVTPGGIYDKQSKDFIAKYSQKTMLNRMARKNEITGALLYFASNLSSYVTGENIVVDGGLTVKA